MVHRIANPIICHCSEIGVHNGFKIRLMECEGCTNNPHKARLLKQPLQMQYQLINLEKDHEYFNYFNLSAIQAPLVISTNIRFSVNTWNLVYTTDLQFGTWLTGT